MKGYNSKMTPQEMWNIVNYLHSLVIRDAADGRRFITVHTDSGGRFFRWAAALLVVAAAVAACRRADEPPPASVFTPAHSSLGAAVNDFLNLRPDPQQPFPFPHNTHVAQKIMCTEYCHESVMKGPIAGLPSVKTCMICHESIATDRPLIKQITDYAEARRRHLVAARLRLRRRRRTSASTTRRTSAPRSSARPATATSTSRPSPSGTSNLNMGFCVDCHKTKQAPNECLTCHF